MRFHNKAYKYTIKHTFALYTMQLHNTSNYSNLEEHYYIVKHTILVFI